MSIRDITDGVRAVGKLACVVYGKPQGVVYDVKCVLPRDAVDGRL